MTNVHTFDAHNKVQLLVAPSTSASVNSDWVRPFADGGGADRAVFLLSVGAITNNVSFKVTQATSSGGAGAKDITGAAITAVTSSTDNVVVSVEVSPGALDDANGFKWIRGEVTVAAAGSELISLMMIKHRLRYPKIGGQHSSYSQQVRVY